MIGSLRGMAVRVFLVTTLLAGLGVSALADNHGGLSQQDLENAARAGLSTGDFQGGQDLNVAPVAQTQRLAELQQLRERGAVEHGQQLTGLIGTLNTQQRDLAAARQQLATGEANLASYEEGETWYGAVDDFFRSNFTNQQTQGTRARSLIRTANEDIERLEAEIANTQTALGTTTQSIAAFNERIDLEERLADPQQRRAEEANRMQNLVEIVTDVETQRVQIGVGQEQFHAQTTALDAAIAEAHQLAASGTVDEDYADELVERYEEEQETIAAAQEEWLAAMYSELERHESLRDYYFEQNQTDRVGATSTGEVLDELRQRATTAGEAPDRATGIDREAVARTEGTDGQPGSATQFSSGALNMPRFNSIFDGIDADSASEFLYDLQEDELDWYEFSLRMGSYTRGVTRAGVDAVTDLAMLLRELGDTQGEAFEAALESMFGVDLDVFGDENLRLLARVRDNAYLLFDADNPEGRRVAEELQQLVENLTRAAQRRIETQAAQGDVHDTLEDVGYVAGTVVGVEEVGLRIAGGALRGGALLWRTADTATDLARAGARTADVVTDANRAAGTATDGSRASRAGTSGTDGTQPFDETLSTPDADGTRPFDETLETPDADGTQPFGETLATPDGDITAPPPTGDATVPPPPGARPGGSPAPADSDDIATVGTDALRARAGEGAARAGPPPEGAARASATSARAVPRTSNDVVRIETVDADTVILHRDGFPPIEAKRIPGAAGATSTVYEVPGRPDLVVKFTEAGTAGALDRGGYNVINAIDPDGSALRTPHNFEHLDAVGGPRNGGTVTVQQRAPDDFKRATSTHAPDGGMTPAQHRAYRRAMDKLNEEGFVWADNKHDNYAFEPAPSPPAEPGELRLVIIDPGGIIPMNGLDADAARRLQRALDDPGRYGYTGGDWNMWRNAVMEGLGEEFDHLINWDAIRRLTGIDYRSLDPHLEEGVCLPYNPTNGRHYPQLTGDPPPIPERAPSAVELARTGLNRAARAGTALAGEALDAAADSRTGRAASRAATGTGQSDDEASGEGASEDEGLALAMGGGMGTPVVDPIFFSFGPGAEIMDYVGMYTYCSPCSHIVAEYNDITSTTLVFTPEVLTHLNMLRAQLPVCEEFYCPTGIADPNALAVVELIRVINVFGNSPYNQLNPTAADSSSSSSGPTVEVLQLYGGGYARLDQFNGIGNPESGPDPPYFGCTRDHYHGPHVADPPLIQCNGNSVSDPRSSGCGFGTDQDVMRIPADQCPYP